MDPGLRRDDGLLVSLSDYCLRVSVQVTGDRLLTLSALRPRLETLRLRPVTSSRPQPENPTPFAPSSRRKPGSMHKDFRPRRKARGPQQWIPACAGMTVFW